MCCAHVGRPYQRITGVFPRDLPDVKVVVDVVVSRGVLNKHKANKIAYRRAT